MSRRRMDRATTYAAARAYANQTCFPVVNFALAGKWAPPPDAHGLAANKVKTVTPTSAGLLTCGFANTASSRAID